MSYPVLLHLTDLHFGHQSTNGKESDDRHLALRSLLEKISALDKEWKPTIICLSGDIAFYGGREDYRLALEWLQKLLEVCQIGPERIVICPGNHDVIRAKAKQLVRPTDAAKADDILTTDIPSFFNEIFDGYIHFCQDAGIPPMELDGKANRLVGWREIEGIQFVSLNSSWYCQDEYDRGNLWVGLPQIRNLVVNEKLSRISKGNSPTTVVLMHHPFSWLNEADQITRGPRSTAEFLVQHCHVLLTGHEHARMGKAHQLFEGAYQFPGGAGYESGTYENGFRLLRLEGSYFKYRSYEYDASLSENNWQQRGTDTTLSRPGQSFIPAVAEPEKKKPII